MSIPLEARVDEISDAYVLPTELRVDSNSIVGAVYNHRGGLVLPSVRPAYFGTWRAADPISYDRQWLEKNAKFIPGKFVYGGHFFNQWGHFIFETLSTAWCADRYGGLTLLLGAFVLDSTRRNIWNALEGRKELLRAAGWEGPIELVIEPLRVQKLFVPHRSSVVGSRYDALGSLDELGVVYDRVVDRLAGDVAQTERIVARRPKGHKRAHPEEEAIYASLASEGWSVIEGWHLSPAEQVRTFASARVVLAFNGSSLHNSAFCPRGTTVIELSDERTLSLGPDEQGRTRANRTQTEICRVKEQPLHVIDTISNGQPNDAESILRAVRAVAD